MVSNVVFASCNDLTLHYVLDGFDSQMASHVAGCGTSRPPNVVITGITPTSNLSFYLREESCTSTASDSFSFNFAATGSHGRIVGTNPTTIDINDGSLSCEYPNWEPRPVEAGLDGNVHDTVTRY